MKVMPVPSHLHDIYLVRNIFSKLKTYNTHDNKTQSQTHGNNNKDLSKSNAEGFYIHSLINCRQQTEGSYNNAPESNNYEFNCDMCLL